MNNSDQFSTFASQVFAILYESFPVLIPLPRNQIIDTLENNDELWALKSKASMVEGLAEVYESAGQMTPEMKEGAKRNVSDINARIRDKEQRLRQMGQVLDGTVHFLVSEGFIRPDDNDNGYYQLTLKGLTHLNKRFQQGAIQGNTTIIDRLRDALRPEKFAGSVTSGVLTSLVTSAFGP